MLRPRKTFGKSRVEQCRARIAAGFYDSPKGLRRLLSPRLLNSVLADLELCPVGEGNSYRDLAAEFLGGCLREIVDEPLVQVEIPCHGGRVDIELPLRLEELDAHPLWSRWADRYEATSILVEVKNESGKTDFGAGQQIGSYLELADRGRLGAVVSRAGFTKNAMTQLATIARKGNSLILPITHNDLAQIAKAKRRGVRAVAELFRRKQTLLLQMVG